MGLARGQRCPGLATALSHIKSSPSLGLWRSRGVGSGALSRPVLRPRGLVGWGSALGQGSRVLLGVAGDGLSVASWRGRVVVCWGARLPVSRWWWGAAWEGSLASTPILPSTGGGWDDQWGHWDGEVKGRVGGQEALLQAGGDEGEEG